MTVTVESFREQFPAFADAVKYSDAAVGLWLTVAQQMVGASRWGDMTDVGVSLYVAHNLALEAQAVKAGNAGAVPGAAVGILNSKAAAGVSAGYDVTTSTEKDAGAWNLTTYGTRFYRLSRMMGAGPVQVGSDDVLPTSMAWAGPIYPP